MRLTTIALAAIALLLLAAIAVAPATRIDLTRSSVPIEVGSTEAPADVPLADVLSGRQRPGFFPALDGSVLATPRPGTVTWLRLRAELPAGQGRWYLRLERAPIDRVAVLLPAEPAREVAERRYFRLGSWDAGWPDGFVLPLPEGLSGAQAIYVRVEGRADVDLRPQLIDGELLEAREAASLRLFALLYGVMLLALVASFLRRVRVAAQGTTDLALLTLASITTIALVNDHVPSAVRIVAEPWLGGALVYAATIFLAGALLVAVRRQAGLSASSATLDLAYRRVGLALMVLALASTQVPDAYLDLQRRVAELVWSQTWVLVLLAFLMDRRRLRLVPITLLGLLLVALAVRALAANGVVPPSALALYGWQMLMALLLLTMVLLPWLRSLPVAAPKVAAPAPELPVDERWEQARERMVAAIGSALSYGGEAEADWVVAHRLIDALGPLLDARSVAVARASLHGEQHVLVEPPEFEDAYRTLVHERARVLRTLLRLSTPQQLFVPMGLDTPSQVAIVPYVQAASGWTAVMVERHGAGFSSEEMARIEALVAAAREVASHALGQREAAIRADLDPSLAVLNAEALQRTLRSAFERCRDQGAPIALLRLPLSGAGGCDARAKLALESLDAIETLPVHLLGRPGVDELWVVLPGQDVPAARRFAETLHAHLAPAAPEASGLLPAGARPALAEWIIGVGGSLSGELVSRAMIERAGEALARARAPGAGAVQSGIVVEH